jgi:site-specific recombinase XerD
MKMKSLPDLLHGFFNEWMTRQKNLSQHTVRSYRDTWKLLLNFLSDRKHRSIAALSLTDIDEAEVIAFLQYLEDKRNVSISTRNCRLAAIHSFFGYAARQEPLMVAQCSRIARIPVKKTVTPTMSYLDADEVRAVLRQPDRSTPEGHRDHVLLALLYNTGARIQEALNVCPGAIRFESPAQVQLLGKGSKTRVCPLWRETVDLIQSLLTRIPRQEGQPIFVNRYGQALTARGVRFKLTRYLRAAAREVPSLAKKRVSPHTFRHTVGVQLVASGVDVTVIRNWLGHANLDTTNRYARANLETKRKALEQIDSSTRPARPPRWKRNPDLLEWLNSL